MYAYVYVCIREEYFEEKKNYLKKLRGNWIKKKNNKTKKKKLFS